MKKHVLALAAAALAAAAVPAMAQKAEGPWMVRARAVHLQASNSDTVPGVDLSVNNKWIPEVDVSYFVTPNVAAELILTIPQKHTLYGSGTSLGTLKHLPPTLTLQYHFDPKGSIRPYVGAGLNYTRFSSVDVAAGGTKLDVKRSSWGGAVQAGVDIPLDKNLYLNFDVKKVLIKTDVLVAATGEKLGEYKINPMLVGVGLGWRF